MKTITTLLITLFTVVTAWAADQRSFATEAEVTLDQTSGHYLVITLRSEGKVLTRSTFKLDLKKA